MTAVMVVTVHDMWMGDKWTIRRNGGKKKRERAAGGGKWKPEDFFSTKKAPHCLLVGGLKR